MKRSGLSEERIMRILNGIKIQAPVLVRPPNQNAPPDTDPLTYPDGVCDPPRIISRVIRDTVSGLEIRKPLLNPAEL